MAIATEKKNNLDLGGLFWAIYNFTNSERIVLFSFGSVCHKLEGLPNMLF